MLAMLTLSLVPGGLLYALQRAFAPLPESWQRARRRLYLYLATFLGLWLAILLPQTAIGGSIVSLLAVPLAIALIPIIWLHLRAHPELRDRASRPWLALYALLLVAVSAALISWSRVSQDLLALALMVGITGVCIAVIWELRLRGGRWLWGLLTLFLVIALLVDVHSLLYVSVPIRWSDQVVATVSALFLLLLPVAMVALAGFEMSQWPQQDTATRVRRGALVTLGVLAIVALLAYPFSERLLLDRATDGLSALLATIVAVFAIYAVAILLFFQVGWRHVGLVAVFLAFFAVALVGVVQFDSQRSPREVTADRAARVDAAIQAYHAAEGVYPARLEELTPWTLLFVPRPVLFEGQVWCYESSGTSYQLGYVTRPTWGVMAEFITLQMAGSGGMPPAESATCQPMLAAYQQRFGFVEPGR